MNNPVYQMIINYGYVAIFLILAYEGTGMPFPVEFVFLASSYLITSGEMNIVLVIISIVLGNLTGNLLIYLILSRGGRPLLDKYGKKIGLRPEDISKMDRWFERYGGITIAVSRIIGIPRTPAIWAAGLSKMHFITYMVFSAIGDTLWAVFWVLFNTYLLWLVPYLYKNHRNLFFLIGIIVLVFVVTLWKLFINIWKRGAIK